MTDRFSDDNFIEAAKAYQNIKAPSDLREKVLQTAVMQEQMLSGSDMAEFRRPQKQKKRHHARIYQAASLAACLAMMVAVLPSWTLDVAPDEHPGPQPRAIIGEEPGLPLEGDSATPDEYGVSAAEFPPESDGEPAGEPAANSGNEPVFERNQADIPAEDPSTEPVLQNGAENEPAQPEPPAVTDPQSKSAEPALLCEPDEEKETENTPEPETENLTEKDFEEEEDVAESSSQATVPSISVGALLPAFLSENETLRNVQVRLAGAENGSCLVEVILDDSTTAEVMVTKNDENGHWEVTSAEEE